MRTSDHRTAAATARRCARIWIWLTALGLSAVSGRSIALAETYEERSGVRFAREFAQSLDEARRTEPAYAPSGEVGSDLEERLSGLLGVDAELAFAPVDSRYMIEHGDRWVQSAADIALRVRSYGPDLEIESGPGAERYRGPVVGDPVVGSHGYYLLRQGVPSELDEDFVWSGVIEMSIPLADSDHWSFKAGLRYMTFQVPFTSQREVLLALAPEIAVVGFGLRF